MCVSVCVMKYKLKHTFYYIFIFGIFDVVGLSEFLGLFSNQDILFLHVNFQNLQFCRKFLLTIREFVGFATLSFCRSIFRIFQFCRKFLLKTRKFVAFSRLSFFYFQFLESSILSEISSNKTGICRIFQTLSFCRSIFRIFQFCRKFLLKTRKFVGIYATSQIRQFCKPALDYSIWNGMKKMEEVRKCKKIRSLFTSRSLLC